LHPSGVAKSSTSFGWGKGGNVTSAGWQVTLCDPIWYVSSRSGDGRPACKLLYAPFTFTFTFYNRDGIPSFMFPRKLSQFHDFTVRLHVMQRAVLPMPSCPSVKRVLYDKRK